MPWFIEFALQYLLKNLTEEFIVKCADKLKNIIIPYVRKYKDQLISELRKRTAATATPIDDEVLDMFETFIEAFIPDNPTTIHDV